MYSVEFSCSPNQLLIVPVNGGEWWLGYTLQSPTGFQMLCMSLSPPVQISHLNLTLIDFKRELTLHDN